MSHSYYNKQWQNAQINISDILQEEMPPKPLKPQRDRMLVFQMLTTMYIKYIRIMRCLEECYDQITHPQKRPVLRQCLDGVMGRILELKHEMINLEFSEYHYIDDVLSDLKLTPDDAIIPIPHYFRNERAKVLDQRAKLLEQILAKFAPKDKEEALSRDEAIRIIQVHERARQGRFRAYLMLQIYQEEHKKHFKKQPSLYAEDAALRIQKLWKGFARRSQTKKEREEELIFIGMTPSPTIINTEIHKAESTKEYRRRMQDNYEQEFQQALMTIHDMVLETEGPMMKETMMDQIRQWFIECRDLLGKFPDYPEDEDGGSSAIFKEKTPDELARELKEMDEKNVKGKKGQQGKKKEAEKKKKGGIKEDEVKKEKKGQKDKEDDGMWKMAPSNFVPIINEASSVYKDVWSTRDETENYSQRYESEMVKEEKRQEVEREIRTQVDELMRIELSNLKAVVEKQKAKKKKNEKKKGKKGEKKKNEKKKGKKGEKKKKKGKKEKDLTANRTIEELYEELVTEGIIVRPQPVCLADYMGDYSYLGTVLRQAELEPMPSIYDVRTLITEFAILPLGSAVVHERAPLTKSILLAGPKGCGKRMLVHALCNEVGANLFDLSPANLVGKYPGKKGRNMLMHLIYKVGRALQPSVFFVGNCEKMFMRKIPKADRTDPKRLKKELPKSLKNIKPEDRLLLIGTSHCPFEGALNPLVSCYQRIILIPRPDYASRHLIWRSLITKHSGVITDALDISSLAKVTDGYTPSCFITVVQEVLTNQRIKTQLEKPLQAVEFIAPLVQFLPVFREEEELFKIWYGKTPLGEKRFKASRPDDYVTDKKENKDKTDQKSKTKK